MNSLVAKQENSSMEEKQRQGAQVIEDHGTAGVSPFLPMTAAAVGVGMRRCQFMQTQTRVGGDSGTRRKPLGSNHTFTKKH